MDHCSTLSKRGGYKRYIETLILSLKTCKPISQRQSDVEQNVEVCCIGIYAFKLLITFGVQKKIRGGNGDSESKRDSWGNGWEFLMSCIALSVGLGNVWRFPFTCLDNGGIYYSLTFYAINGRKKIFKF